MRLAWLVAAAGMVVGLAPSGAGAQDDIVELGDLLAISNAGVYIGIEKGYFKEQKIQNRITTFASAGKAMPALTTGELDVSVGTISAGLFNAIGEGAGFRIVADKGQGRAGTGYVLLTVRKDLVQSGQVKSVKDLKGRKVSLYAKGINQDYILGKMAEEVGLTIKDFEIVYLAGPSQLTAYETKAIDAAMVVEPWGANFEEKGVGVRFRTPDQVKSIGPMQIAVVMYSEKFIKERRAQAQRWMNAYLKGAAYYATKGTQDAEVVSIIEKYTKVPAKAIRAAIPHGQSRDGRPIMDSIADQIAWFAANGYLPKRVTADQVVDLSFLR
jgi:NitT/TauT family transport system substrate-binding protein